MTATTLPRDKRTLIGLLETAFKKTNETEIGEIIRELGPHVDSLKREIMIDGRKGETVTVSLMYTDWIADDDKDTKTPRMIKGQWPIRNQWPVEAGCRVIAPDGPPAQRISVASQATHEGPITDFVADACAVGGDTMTLAGELYTRYATWCLDNGYLAASQRKFGLELTSRGYQRKRRGKGRHWWVGLQPQD